MEHVWGWLIAFYLFLGGLGGSTMIIAYYYHKRRVKELAGLGSMIAVASVILGVLCLILDLEKPEKFYLVMLSPNINFSSWVLRGTLILSGFILFSLLFVAGYLKWFKWLPWTRSEAAMDLLGLLASAFGFLTTTYTGILIGSVKAVPFWNSPALPALFVASGIATGIATVLLVNVYYGLKASDDERPRFLHYCHQLSHWGAIIVGAELFILLVYFYLMSLGPVGARAGVETLLFGGAKRSFAAYLDLVIVGSALLALIAHIRAANKEAGKPLKVSTQCILPIVAATLIILGGIMLRHTILLGGVPVEFLPP